MDAYHHWPFLSDTAHPLLSALWAVLAHGVLAVLVVAPVLWTARHRLGMAALAFIAGSVIDFDHFIVAGSFDLHTIETLGYRPATHSLLFVALAGVVTLVLTRRSLLAWSLFAVWTSHILFDAAGGGERFFYPLGSDEGLPWLALPLGSLALLAGSWLIVSRRGARRGVARAAPVGSVAA